MGEPDAFTDFVRAHEGALVRLAWALTGDRQTGEDLAQATLDKLWTRWERVSANGDPWPYTQRIAVSLASTWWRRRWRHAEVAVADVPETAATLDESAAVQSRQIVATWLDALPCRQRAVVVLRFLADLSVEESAHALRCSSGTVKSQTAKALAHLRSLAEQYSQSEEMSHDQS